MSYVTEELMILTTEHALVGSILVRRIGKAYEAELLPIHPEYFPMIGMTRRNAVERLAIRDALAHALCTGNPTHGGMRAEAIAASHGLILESVFTSSPWFSDILVNI